MRTTKSIIISIGLISILFISCDILPAKEPIIKQQDNAIVVGDFDVTVTSITDHIVSLSWTASQNASSYDIIVNDTLAIYNIKNNYYSIEGLKANTNQKICIRAISKDLSVKISTVTLKTMQELYDEVRQIYISPYDYNITSYSRCMPTNDGGYLLIAAGTKNDVNCDLAIKTDKDFNVTWSTMLALGFTTVSRGFRFNTDIQACKDGGYLFVMGNYVAKVSNAGQLLWFNPNLLDDTSLDFVNGGIEMEDGTYLLVGTSSKNWTSGAKRQYTFTKLSSNGQMIWKKTSSGALNRDAYKIVKSADGNYFVYGIIQDSQSSFVKIDPNGNILSEYSYNDGDIFPILLYAASDNNYYLLQDGTINISKVNSAGSVIWSKNCNLFPGADISVRTANVIVNDNILIVSCLNYGYYIVYQYNSDGTMSKSTTLGNMSDCIYISKDDNGRYIYITTDGYVLMINPDGYFSNM